MSIRIGVYDLFSHTLPGVIYLFSIIYVVKLYDPTSIPIDFFNLSIGQMVIYGTLSYIITILLDPFANFWFRIFISKSAAANRLQELDKIHHKISLNFKPHEWPIFLAFIKQESMEVATDIERFKATHVMLRNIGFGLLIFGLIQLVMFFARKFSLSHFFTAIPCFIFSIIAIKQGAKYDSWFYSMIYEAIAARTRTIKEYFDQKN